MVLLLHCSATLIVSSFGFAQDFGLCEAMINFYRTASRYYGLWTIDYRLKKLWTKKNYQLLTTIYQLNRS